jgi:alkanesulfonate monooxygenase SsuD/methylene tetrahydromethanopterin reductase-like flavin-dependent oxidoreductase (luciferase family)
MWTWITESRVERERVLADVLAPLLKRNVDELRDRVCVGSAGQCAELLSRYAGAGCQRVYLWPVVINEGLRGGPKAWPTGDA